MSTVTVRSRPSAKAAGALDRLVFSISRYERRWLFGASVLFALLAVYEALTAPLWFDEFFTLFIARLSSFRAMLQAMPADGQPPLQYLLVHPFLKWFGETELPLRLASILAWLAAGLLTWKIVRRHGTPVQALFSFVVLLGATTGSLWLSGISLENQAFTARPYQMVLALTALAYLSWQTATLRSNRRLLPLCGLALSIAAAVLTHHYAILQIGAFLVTGEVFRFLRRQRLDFPLLAAACTGLLPLVFTVPLAIQSRNLIGVVVERSTNFWDRPSLAHLAAWPAFTPWLLFLPLTILACLPESSRPGASEQDPLPAVPRHEIAAATGLVLLPPAQLLLAIAKTHYFFPRYAIGGVLGFALLFAWAWPRAGYLRQVPQRAFASLTVMYLVATTACLLIEPFIYPIGRTRLVANGVSPVSLNVPGDLPIVDANACDYLQEYWYEPPPLQQRLIYLSDLPYAEKTPGFIAEISLVVDKGITPFPVADYSAFLSKHSHFLVLRTGHDADNWLPDRLRNEGWRLTPLRQAGRDVLFEASRP